MTTEPKNPEPSEVIRPGRQQRGIVAEEMKKQEINQIMATHAGRFVAANQNSITVAKEEI